MRSAKPDEAFLSIRHRTSHTIRTGYLFLFRIRKLTFNDDLVKKNQGLIDPDRVFIRDHDRDQTLSFRVQLIVKDQSV
jgi:hypothetical protein